MPDVLLGNGFNTHLVLCRLPLILIICSLINNSIDATPSVIPHRLVDKLATS